MNTHALDNALREHPDRTFVSDLLTDLTHGVRIGYTGPRTTSISSNHPSAHTHPDLMTTDIENDLACGVLEGPYDLHEIPYTHFTISPLGAIVKTREDGTLKFRRVHDLSYPQRGDSINAHISKDYAPVQYSQLDDALNVIRKLGPGTRMSVVDIKSAFRHVPIHPDDVCLMGFQWNGQFYFERALPFGLRSSPGLYDRLARALVYIARQ